LLILCTSVAGQQLQTLARDGDLEGFMQTYDVLIDERTGTMRGARGAIHARGPLSTSESPTHLSHHPALPAPGFGDATSLMLQTICVLALPHQAGFDSHDASLILT